MLSLNFFSVKHVLSSFSAIVFSLRQFYIIFIMRKIALQCSSRITSFEISTFIHRWDYVWKCKFDKVIYKNKTKNHYYYDEEQQLKKKCLRNFKTSMEEVILMSTEKRKAKCIKEYVWISFLSQTCGMVSPNFTAS